MRRALLPIALAACGGAAAPGDPPADPCPGIVCQVEHLFVDPVACRCTCGDPVLALVCAPDERCTRQGGLYTCEVPEQPLPCSDVFCDRGQRCDPVTETCVCGSLPPVACADFQTCESERCVPATRCEAVDCGHRGTCDERDGSCRCGELVCGDQERCVDGACELDLCSGVNCPEGNVCNGEDGLCHCGGAVGPVCAAGQVCTEGVCEEP